MVSMPGYNAKKSLEFIRSLDSAQKTFVETIINIFTEKYGDDWEENELYVDEFRKIVEAATVKDILGVSANDADTINETLQCTHMLSDLPLTEAKNYSLLASEKKGVPTAVAIKPTTPNDKSAEAKFVLGLNNRLGISQPVCIPLYGSGIRITVRPTNLAEDTAIQVGLANDVIDYTRTTLGTVYNNFTYYVYKELIDILLRTVSHTSLGAQHTIHENYKKKLGDIIKLNDINAFVMGSVATKYPNGYDATIQCKNSVEITDDNKPSCNFSKSARFNPLHLFHTDFTRLGTICTDVMATGAKTMDELDSYTAVLYGEIDKKSVVYEMIDNDDVKHTYTLNLEVPSINRYFEVAKVWNTQYNNVLKSLLTDKEKKNEGLVRAEVKSIFDITQDVSYIASVDLVSYTRGDSGEYDTTVNSESTKDPKTIITITENLTNKDRHDGTTKLSDAISDFIDYTTITVIGTRTFTCEVCKEKQTESNESNAFDEFIPLNVLSLFFVLGGTGKVA